MAGLLPDGTKTRHPQDGAHADVRIRISDEAVTFSIQANVAFLDGIADIYRENHDDVAPIEEQAVLDVFSEFVRTRNEVSVDGITIPPTFREIEFRRPGEEFLPLFPRSGWLGLLRVQAIIDYPLKSAPRSVSMVWGGFPPDVIAASAESAGSGEEIAESDAPPLVVSALLTAEGTEKIIEFRETEPQFVWHASDTDAGSRFLPVPESSGERPGTTIAVPVVSLSLLAGMVVLLLGLRFTGQWPRGRKAFFMAIPIFLIAAGLTLRFGIVQVASPFSSAPALPTEIEAEAIFQPLHANIYRAFDYTNESDIYDALAQSVDGELLDSLYNQVYRSLIMQEEGGAVSRVQAVTPLETEVNSIGLLPPDERPGFSVNTRWQVEGAVYHWGHSHTRVNEYHAEYTVVSTNDGWRIAGNRMIEQFRVDSGEEPAALPPALEPGQDI